MGEQSKPTEEVIKWRVHEGDLLDDDGEPLESQYWHVVTHGAFARVSAALASAREENEMLSRDSGDAALQVESDFQQIKRLRERERVLTGLLRDAATQLDQCAVWLIEDRAQAYEVSRVENLAAELRAALTPEPQ